MFGEIKNSMVKLFGSRVGQTCTTNDGAWRSVEVSEDGALRVTDPSSFFPYAGSNVSLVVSAVSVHTSAGQQFVSGKEYILWSTVPCHIVLGISGVFFATGNDPHIPANVLFPFVPVGASERRLAVLKSTLIIPAPADGLLFIFRSSR